MSEPANKLNDWAALDQRIARRLRHKGFFEIGSPMQFCLRIRSEYADESFFRDTSRWHVTFGDSDQNRHG